MTLEALCDAESLIARGVDVLYDELYALAAKNVTPHFYPPYLVEFDFALRDGEGSEQHAVVGNPESFALLCLEDLLKDSYGIDDGEPISNTETAVHISKASMKQLKAMLVLDYTASMTLVGPEYNADTSPENGVSDAVDAMEVAAKALISAIHSRSRSAQIGIYEFHQEDVIFREDRESYLVHPFTTRTEDLIAAVNSIREEHAIFSSSTICWDAVYTSLGEFEDEVNADEQRLVIIISDGNDESSARQPEEITELAKNKGGQDLLRWLRNRTR